MKQSKTISDKNLIAILLAALAIFFYLFDMVWGISLNALSKTNVLLLIVYIAPFIMWFMYVLTLHKREKSKIIVQIVFGVFALSAMINCITGLLNTKTIMETAENTLTMLSSMFIMIVSPILQVPLFALTMYLFYNKKSSAYKPLIGIIIVFIMSHMINIVTYYRFLSTSHMRFAAFNGIAYTVFFYLSAIVFLKYSKISSNTAEATQYLNPQQSLSDLQSQFDSGAITEEEYSERRAEILNSL